MNNALNGRQLIVDATATRFLSDRAMVEMWVRKVAEACGMTILSITGYDLRNAAGQEPGVSVVALMAESHISVHTWPQEGVITLDAYSCRGFDVQMVLGSFTEHFEVSRLLRHWELERFGLTKVLA